MAFGWSRRSEDGFFPRRFLPRLLMALLFVGGVMNLIWIALIAALVLAEKVLPHGNLLGKLGGIVMLALAGFSFSKSLFS